jgi:hypothetical protein
MRRLRRFLPPNQEKDQNTDDNHQNATYEDQSRWHTVCSRYDATPRRGAARADYMAFGGKEKAFCGEQKLTVNMGD